MATLGTIGVLLASGPVAAADPICPGVSLVHRTFNAFWAEFDRTYALFDIRLPDRSWEELGRLTCREVRANLDDEEFSQLLLRLARQLDDSHVMLRVPELDLEEEAVITVYPFDDEVDGIEHVVEEHYLDGKLKWGARNDFAWGRIGTVGYLAITGMDDLSRSGSKSDDVKTADRTIARALRDLRGVEAIVVDVRGNGGGWDAVSLTLARHFAGDRKLVWSKQRRDGPRHNDFSDWKDVYVGNATDDAFGGPVVLLTSGGSTSAAETFALAMRVRDNVTILGETTSGHFSDMYDERLPNGWEIELSGERYRAADGQIYEGRGLPPDVPVLFDPAALSEGTDVILEAALAHLNMATDS
jgi:hypothetical protein